MTRAVLHNYAPSESDRCFALCAMCLLPFHAPTIRYCIYDKWTNHGFPPNTCGGCGAEDYYRNDCPKKPNRGNFLPTGKGKGKGTGKGKGKWGKAGAVRMKKRHGQEKLLKKVMSRRRMRATAFGIGMRETQSAGGLWMIMMKMRVMMKCR